MGAVDPTKVGDPGLSDVGGVEAFLKADNWMQLTARSRGGGRQRHIFFEKALASGRVLQTHISHDRSATIGAGRFSDVLRNQLEVSRSEFWAAIRSGREVARPIELEEVPQVEHPYWIVRVLAGELHMSPEEIGDLPSEQAEGLVRRHWSRRRND